MRALELHASSHIWNPKITERVLDFMVERDLTTLILHEVRILEQLVYPGRYFGATDKDRNIYERYRASYEMLYKYTPGRRSKPYEYLEQIKWLLRRAAERNIEVYLNNKELFFHEVILELQPQLTKDGVLCPTEPFWFEFLRDKYEELYEDLPDLTGTITAPGTGESRLSISGNRCTCDRCQSTDPSQWYLDVLNAIHEPTAAAGRKFVVRDFVFDKATQDQLVAAFAKLPGDIAVCFKNTPHDYYPTFPDNERIGQARDREQWVEFDVMGQYFGWGIAPAILIDDSRKRFAYAAERGVTGILIRVDWEALEGHSAFDTPNLISLYAQAMLAVDPSTTDEQIYTTWLRSEGYVPDDADDATVARCAQWAADAFDPSWPIVAGTLYSHDCVFSDSSAFPVSLDNTYWLAEHKNSLRDWDPSKWDALTPTPDNVASLLAEKHEALARWEAAYEKMSAANPGLVADRYDDLVRRYAAFGLYVEGFKHVLASTITLRHALQAGKAADPAIVAMIPDAINDLSNYLDRIDGHELADWFPAGHVINAMRLRALYDDVVAIATDKQLLVS